MIAELSIRLVVVALYVLDLLAMAAPILLWASLGVYADFSMPVFVSGWLVVLMFSATLWLKLLARLRNRLWAAFIERDPGSADDSSE